MVYIKTKEGASLLVALLAAVIVAVTTTLLDVVWWMTLCAAAGVFVVMALVALFIRSCFRATCTPTRFFRS